MKLYLVFSNDGYYEYFYAAFTTMALAQEYVRELIATDRWRTHYEIRECGVDGDPSPYVVTKVEPQAAAR